MKKWILSAAILIAATFSALANSQVIADLKANVPAKINCQFEQQKFLKGMAKPVISKGSLTYTKDNLNMTYTQPAGDYLLISPTEFTMQTKGKVRKHNIKAGSPMLVLKNTLTMCMDGDVEAVAKENGAALTYANNGNHQFTLTKELKKGEKGYAKIVLEYNPKTYVLTNMTMVEANGNYTVYNLTNHK